MMSDHNHADRGASQELITSYELEMCPPACVPGAATWSARAVLDLEIDAVLPYLYARLEASDYDHQARILIWKDRDHKFAFRSREIKAAPALDREEAKALIDRAVALLNDTWRERESIEPRFERRTLPNLMQLYRLLPRTNCSRCGCATCMAFAASIREGRVELERCTALDRPEHRESRRVLLTLLQPVAPSG